jgi:hypothetical protein
MLLGSTPGVPSVNEMDKDPCDWGAHFLAGNIGFLYVICLYCTTLEFIYIKTTNIQI